MSAPNGICLHQIIRELGKINESMREDLSAVESEPDWRILCNHIDELDELIENIGNV
jgi:hypothetical protein